jgi:integrase
VRRANAVLAQCDEAPLPELSPHSLRRTFISLLLHARRPVPYVMAQAGHTDPKVTLGIYARVLACLTTLRPGWSRGWRDAGVPPPPSATVATH